MFVSSSCRVSTPCAECDPWKLAANWLATNVWMQVKTSCQLVDRKIPFLNSAGTSLRHLVGKFNLKNLYFQDPITASRMWMGRQSIPGPKPDPNRRWRCSRRIPLKSEQVVKSASRGAGIEKHHPPQPASGIRDPPRWEHQPGHKPFNSCSELIIWGKFWVSQSLLMSILKSDYFFWGGGSCTIKKHSHFLCSEMKDGDVRELGSPKLCSFMMFHGFCWVGKSIFGCPPFSWHPDPCCNGCNAEKSSGTHQYPPVAVSPLGMFLSRLKSETNSVPDGFLMITCCADSEVPRTFWAVMKTDLAVCYSVQINVYVCQL